MRISDTDVPVDTVLALVFLDRIESSLGESGRDTIENLEREVGVSARRLDSSRGESNMMYDLCVWQECIDSLERTSRIMSSSEIGNNMDETSRFLDHIMTDSLSGHSDINLSR